MRKIKEALCLESVARQPNPLHRVCRFNFVRKEEDYQRWSYCFWKTIVSCFHSDLECLSSIPSPLASILSTSPCTGTNMSFEWTECLFPTCMLWIGQRARSNKMDLPMGLQGSMMMDMMITSTKSRHSQRKTLGGTNPRLQSQSISSMAGMGTDGMMWNKRNRVWRIQVRNRTSQRTSLRLYIKLGLLKLRQSRMRTIPLVLTTNLSQRPRKLSQLIHLILTLTLQNNLLPKTMILLTLTILQNQNRIPC